MITVRKAYGSTIFQRMWRNGHERTRVDTHCDPALAADISDVNDGYFHHFVTVPLAPSARPEALEGSPALASCLVPRISQPSPRGGLGRQGTERVAACGGVRAANPCPPRAAPLSSLVGDES